MYLFIYEDESNSLELLFFIFKKRNQNLQKNFIFKKRN